MAWAGAAVRLQIRALARAKAVFGSGLLHVFVGASVLSWARHSFLVDEFGLQLDTHRVARACLLHRVALGLVSASTWYIQFGLFSKLDSHVELRLLSESTGGQGVVSRSRISAISLVVKGVSLLGADLVARSLSLRVSLIRVVVAGIRGLVLRSGNFSLFGSHTVVGGSLHSLEMEFVLAGAGLLPRLLLSVLVGELGRESLRRAVRSNQSSMVVASRGRGSTVSTHNVRSSH